ncbi:CAP domain-containing protein [Lachnospiraceae bacterium ZAX-1]
MTRRNSYSKILSLLLSLMITMAAVPLFAMKADAAASGIHVEAHTKEAIKSYIKLNGAKIEDPTTFATNPSTSAPYSAGTLTSGSLQSALAMLNQMRYIAGIDADVTLNETYNQKTQAAALLNYLNDTLSHDPAKPSGINDALFNLGHAGAGESNIAYAASSANIPGYHTLNQRIVKGWMEDADASNVSLVGHRRWVLNPAMAQTGFGMVAGQLGSWYKSYYAMYAFDSARTSTYNGVAWPAQNMPIEYFGDTYPWSVSLGKTVDAGNVSVTLTRQSDHKEWVFNKNTPLDATSNENGTYFNVNNDGYGAKGCIIFRPADIVYANGDAFDVKITGVSPEVSYTVNFFSLLDAPVITTQPISATYSKSATAAYLSVSVTGEGLTYQWYSNTTSSNQGGTKVSTSAQYRPSTQTVGTTYYYVKVSNNGGTAISDTAKIVVEEPHIAVTDIKGIPTKATAGTELVLSGTVAPSTATNKTITWSVKNAGTTGATINDGNKLNTTAEGMAVITATVANGLTATSNFTKDVTITVKERLKISAGQFTVSGISNQYYTGVAIKPSITVKYGTKTLKAETDYTLTYKNNIEAGQATIAITGKGDYAGSKNVAFTILSDKETLQISVQTTTSITLKWSKGNSAQGYHVYRASSKNGIYTKVKDIVAASTTTYKDSKLKSATAYYYQIIPYGADGKEIPKNASVIVGTSTKPETPKIALKAGSKSATATWNKVTGANGYELYRATSKKGTYTKVKAGNITKYTNKKLKAKTTYYYKVRAYKNVDGKKVHGAYSAEKKIKVK